jgi:hypothetical protein
MAEIPLYLAVAQWALLGALGVLVVVMFRQLGHLVKGSASTGELGPPVGSAAAPLAYRRPGEQDIRSLAPGDGQPALVAFVDPTCRSCEELVLTLDAMRDDGELSAVRVLLLISDPASYLRISEAFQRTGLEIGRPADPSGLAAYRVTGTPLLVAVDSAGTVAAAGPTFRRAEVRGYRDACLHHSSTPHQVRPGPPASPAVAGRGDP